jgi:hypothetical protein
MRVPWVEVSNSLLNVSSLRNETKKEGICIFPQGGLRNTRTLFGNNPALLENRAGLLKISLGVFGNTLAVLSQPTDLFLMHCFT